MFPFAELSHFEWNDMAVSYLRQGEKIGLAVIPAGMETRIPAHRADLNDTVAARSYTRTNKCTLNAAGVESLVQFKLRNGMICGEDTMRNSDSVNRLHYLRQEVDGDAVKTYFSHPSGVQAIHTLKHSGDAPYLEVNTELVNESKTPVDVDMLESFSLGMLSPFQTDCGCDKYVIHRFRSFWSAEGRHVAEPAEDLGLEMAWAPFAARTVRFGTRSSFPVKEFFPAVGFEDTEAKVTWLVQLAALGPWQLEVSRSNDFLNISGGFPDRQFSNWSRRLLPGEHLEGPTAILTCVAGDVQDALARTVQWTTDHAFPAPAGESDLPVLFNEFCTTWGKPASARLNPLVSALKNRDIRYFVLDAGWYCTEGSKFNGIGDWELSTDKYPEGFGAFIQGIRDAGFIPGVWFEFEHCGQDSHFGQNREDLQMKLDGMLCRLSGDRRFLDFRNRKVWDFLDERMLKFLKTYHFGYMKVDCNIDSTGFDSDHGSPNWGVCEWLDAVRAYFEHIREAMPELVIEICASGGHRLTPEWLRIGDMASFSDAHESEAIPLIAANTQMLIPIDRNQVWATLRKEDGENRLRYSLASGFLGRLCISGDPDQLSATQFRIVADAIAFTRKIVPLLKQGKSRVERSLSSKSYNAPAGCQVFRRTGDAAELVVIHTFHHAPGTISVKLGEMRTPAEVFKASGTAVKIAGGEMTVTGLGDADAMAVILRRG